MKQELNERVKYAKSVINRNGNTSREFDGCFECGDGDEVVIELVRTARRSEKFREKLTRYICSESILKADMILDGKLAA